MFEWIAPRLDGVQVTHGQMLESVGGNQFVEAKQGFNGLLEFSETMLCRQFPGARRTHQNLVAFVGDRFARLQGSSGASVNHPSKAWVSGSNFTFPPTPQDRRPAKDQRKPHRLDRPADPVDACPKTPPAASAAHRERPALARTISCPAWACSSNLEKWVLLHEH